MLSSELVCCLADVHWLHLILLPESEELFCDAKRGAQIVDRHWHTLTQLLKDRLQFFLRAKLLRCERCSCHILHACFGWLELLSLVCDVFRVGVQELAFVILDQKIEGTRSIASALGTGVSGNSDNPDSIELSKLVVLELLRDRPRNQVTRGAKSSFQLLSDSLFADLAFKADLDGD